MIISLMIIVHAIKASISFATTLLSSFLSLDPPAPTAEEVTPPSTPIRWGDRIIPFRREDWRVERERERVERRREEEEEEEGGVARDRGIRCRSMRSMDDGRAR